MHLSSPRSLLIEISRILSQCECKHPEVLQMISSYLAESTVDQFQGHEKTHDKLSSEVSEEADRSPFSQTESLCHVSVASKMFEQLNLSPPQMSRVIGPTTLKDFFVLQFCNRDSKYDLLSIDDKNSFEDRHVYAQLILTAKEDATTKLKRTNSMTEILTLSTNPPKVSKPIIFPNFNGKEDRFIYVFQVQDCAKYINEYFKTPRFFFFLTNKFCYYRIVALMKKLESKYFEIKLLHRQQTSQIEEDETKQSFRNKVLPEMKGVISIFNQQQYCRQDIGDQQQRDWISYISIADNYNVQIRMNSLYSKNISLQILIYYLIIAEYKIIIVSSHGYRAIISQLFMAVLYSLKPIKYIGPIMVAGCNQHHYEFIHSPVPMLLGLWGNDHLLDKCRVKIGELINKEQCSNGLNLPTVLIDLNSMSVHQKQGTKSEQTILQGVSKQLKNASEESCIARRLHQLTKQMLQLQQAEGHWKQQLQTELFKTQMYSHYLTER